MCAFFQFVSKTKTGSIDTRRPFVTPREACDKLNGSAVGGVALVSMLDIPECLLSSSRISNRSLIDIREVKLDLLIKQLKIVAACYTKSSLNDKKTEAFDYLNICKRIYEHLACLNNPSDIAKEMRICDLNEWIWNGTNGFSSSNQIYLIEKTHPLANFVQIIPYELYSFRTFFESMLIKLQPEATRLEDLIRTQNINDENLFKWIKDHYPTDRRLLQIIAEIETKTAKPQMLDDQTKITFTRTLELSEDKIYLHLPGELNSFNLF